MLIISWQHMRAVLILFISIMMVSQHKGRNWIFFSFWEYYQVFLYFFFKNQINGCTYMTKNEILLFIFNIESSPIRVLNIYTYSQGNVFACIQCIRWLFFNLVTKDCEQFSGFVQNIYIDIPIFFLNISFYNGFLF